MNCKDCDRFSGYEKPCVINHMTEEPELYPDKNESSCCYYHYSNNQETYNNYLDSIPKEEFDKIKNDIKNDVCDIDKYDEDTKRVINELKNNSINVKKLKNYKNKMKEDMNKDVKKIMNNEPIHYFNIGDIVIFTWKPNYGLWRKGKIVANNFAVCNLPDFFGKPEYYITELDENDNVIDDKRSVAVDKDSQYIVKFEPGMEWCIGKSSSNNWPKVRDFDKELEDEMLDMKKNMRPFDMILVCINGKWEIDLFQQYIDKEKTKIYTFKKHMILHDANWQPFMYEDEDKHFRQLFNVDEEFVSTSHKDPCGPEGKSGDKLTDDYMNAHGDCPKLVNDKDPNYNYWTSTDFNARENVIEIAKEFPEQVADAKLVTIKENEELWKEKIEKKLDDIAEKLNTMLLQRLEYPNYVPIIPQSPWYTPNYDPWQFDPDRWKVWCNKDKGHRVGTTTWNDTTNIPNSIDSSMNKKHDKNIYTSNVKIGDPDYIMRCNPENTSTTTMTFDYKKYNDMCTWTDKEINAKYENSCLDAKCYNAKGAMDGAIDTWGLAAANNKVNNKKNKKNE